MLKNYWSILNDVRMNREVDITFEGLKRQGLLLLCALLFGFMAKAQQVHSSIDTANIKIGEKIAYRLEVNADTSSTVQMPLGQTFLPFEVFDTTAIDTFLSKNKIRLKREYALTKFDSGAYTIPRQKVLVDGRSFYTDSFQVKVHPVIVDTTKQKLYPRKPALDIKTPFSIGRWVWYILGGLIILALIVY